MITIGSFSTPLLKLDQGIFRRSSPRNPAGRNWVHSVNYKSMGKRKLAHLLSPILEGATLEEHWHGSPDFQEPHHHQISLSSNFLYLGLWQTCQGSGIGCLYGINQMRWATRWTDKGKDLTSNNAFKHLLLLPQILGSVTKEQKTANMTTTNEYG